MIANEDDLGLLTSLELPETYDILLRAFSFAASAPTNPLDTSWTRRALSWNNPSYGFSAAQKRKYKPVDRKVRPVPTYMPDPAGQVFKTITIPELTPLPLNPPYLADFEPTARLTRDRLDFILGMVPKDFLSQREIDLLVYVLSSCEKALAFCDAERGTFSREYFPDYEIPVIEHTPWVQPPIRVPKAIEATVRQMLEEQKAAGKYEYSTASYRSMIFTVLKKAGLRIVHDVQELNKVTICDAALPPRVDDFAEGLVGRVIYALADLFAGYDGRILAVKSRPLTTFNSIIGPHRLTVLPQGATNSVPEFQRCTRHVFQPEIPDTCDVFIDDVTFTGGTSTYEDEEISPGIRRFVYEFATTLRRNFTRMVAAGITASGWKLIIATPELEIVGSVVSRHGWHLKHGLVTKVLNWGEPCDVSDIRSFLGTAGVGRKWIKNFSLISKPLTLLTRGSDREFLFDDEACDAMEKLKQAMASAPVLVRLDYDAASLITLPPRASDEGLVVVAVDSCSNGAGWVVFQHQKEEKHPVIYGSCTFSEVEARYSQPKCELYGVFRALKDLRHRIWGIHFRLDVDAKFLVEMIKTPDLPNAPMTRWVLYLSLFDFEVNHVSADKHAAPDGLSRRKHSPLDSDEEDAEDYLDRFIGISSLVSESPLDHLLTLVSRETNTTYNYMPSFMEGIVDMLRSSPAVPFGDYATATTIDTLSIPWLDDEDDQHDEQVAQIRNYNGFGFDPSLQDPMKLKGSLLTHVLLKSTDTLTYTGHEFENRRTPAHETVQVCLGDEVLDLEITTYSYEYMSKPRQGAPLPIPHDSLHTTLNGINPHNRLDTRRGYEDVDPMGYIACAMHTHGIKDVESPEGWKEVFRYLRDGLIPLRITSLKERKRFLNRTKSFFVHNERLWKLGKNGTPPRLVITDLDKRKSIIAQAHNEVGHRGRDGTFKLITDRFYWPNLYDDIAYFVRSCYSCQLRSKMRPRIPFSPSWNTAILRRFDFDTIHMPRGHKGMHFLLQAVEPAIGWVEARAARRNTASAWATFIYEEIICRFGCIPYCVVDNGSEFQAVAKILLEQYGVVIIVSSPYHPQGNAVAERAHQTLCSAILRACGKHPERWPLYLHAGLLAIRCTASRMTGYSPYFLLYGRNPLLSFDIADRTWETLDWDNVLTTDDLIAVRIQQIARRDEIVTEALKRQKEKRQRAVDDFNRKYGKNFADGNFEVGTWVLKHETWLDNQHGNKGALRWSGPFVIHERLNDHQYRLREIDGTVRREKVSRHRLNIFYFRDD